MGWTAFQKKELVTPPIRREDCQRTVIVAHFLVEGGAVSLNLQILSLEIRASQSPRCSHFQRQEQWMKLIQRVIMVAWEFTPIFLKGHCIRRLANNLIIRM